MEYLGTVENEGLPFQGCDAANAFADSLRGAHLRHLAPRPLEKILAAATAKGT